MAHGEAGCGKDRCRRQRGTARQLCGSGRTVQGIAYAPFFNAQTWANTEREHHFQRKRPPRRRVSVEGSGVKRGGSNNQIRRFDGR